jgi:hypothetical protein
VMQIRLVSRIHGKCCGGRIRPHHPSSGEGQQLDLCIRLKLDPWHLKALVWFCNDLSRILHSLCLLHYVNRLLGSEPL